MGPKRSERLARLGLLTARDVLYHVPHRYEDATTVRSIASVQVGEDVTVAGRIISKGVLPTRRKLRVFQVVVRDRTGSLECAWPGQPHLDRVLRQGDVVLLSGRIRFFHGRQLQPREFTILSRQGEDSTERGTVYPIYPATEGFSHRQVRRVIAENLDSLCREASEEEWLPPRLREKHGLLELGAALRAVHRPASLAEARSAWTRLAFDELFLLQLAHGIARRRARRARPGIAFRPTGSLTRPFLRSLPFALTGAQLRTLREIGEDMARDAPMTRLLQGDVGSGKTVVALGAMLRAVENGFQSALMAPTELLAEQHFQTGSALLPSAEVHRVLLTGRMAAAERAEAIAAIGSGEAQVVIGTHALIQEGVQFARLGLAVVDEQHRFGVRQRQALREMGENPDLLVMSATPIPRSLALTLYGDLDISVLDERPRGRQPVRTAVRHLERREAVYGFVREQVKLGRQAYIVFPLVQESERVDAESAVAAAERLRSDSLQGLDIGLLHGQLQPEEKDRVMRAFRDGSLDVLVATTVVEVGVDVPNATVMIVEHAERFGLSQLHQLRGRVGRGSEGSYCILLTEGTAGSERLDVLERTDDGFEIARADLRHRGFGEFLGERQSGSPGFRIADPEADLALMETARADAEALLDMDPALEAHPEVIEALDRWYGDRIELYPVG